LKRTCFEPTSAATDKTARRKRDRKDTTTVATGDPSLLRFKRLDRLRRDQGLAIAGLKLDKNGAVVDIKFHSKTEVARTLLATLGIKEGDESAGLALVELGRRLGAALARTNDKVIEHGEKPAPLSAPRADDDRVVEIIEC
jgi:hypothetical protein